VSGPGRSKPAALIDVTADADDDYGTDDYGVDDYGTDAQLPRRRWPLRLALGLTLALLIGAAYLVGASPALALRTIVVNGSGAATLSDQVRSAVAVADGTPLALIDLGGVHDRVAAVGPVASVAVQRRWPHTLVVTVTARAPVAVTQANGRWWLLDATGKPYQPVSDPPTTLTKLQLATPGAGDPATMASLGVVGSLSPTLRKDVASISAPSAYAITLQLTDGRTVLWGTDTQNATKAQVLPALLARPGTTFDISDPTLVTVR
jgi:cell division protein FtsQ